MSPSTPVEKVPVGSPCLALSRFEVSVNDRRSCMTAFRPTAIERAFELARSDRYQSVEEVRRRLRFEGLNEEEITGPTLLAQLKIALERPRGHA